MGMLDHWHPILQSKDLRDKPVGVKLAGVEVALFRTKTGQIGALNDVCPHRRMRLSLGSVVGEKLMCKYHGWTFGCDGQGESPGTPKMTACASQFEAREQHDVIWLKSKESNPVFPVIESEGWFPICVLEHPVSAPMELTLDILNEIEHTPTIHEVFGYPLDKMKDVKVEYHVTDETVRVVNTGPSKSLGFVRDIAMGINKDYVFVDDWTTHFSPVYGVYEHYWRHKDDPSREAGVRWRLYMFVTPMDDTTCKITTFAFAKSRWKWFPWHGGLGFYRNVLRNQLDKEITLDGKTVEELADKEIAMEGMKLSRFDKALMLNRERIERIYRGTPGSHVRTQLRIAE